MAKVLINRLADTYANADGSLRFQYDIVYFGNDVDGGFYNQAVDVRIETNFDFLQIADALTLAIQKDAENKKLNVDTDGILNPMVDRHFTAVIDWVNMQLNNLKQDIKNPVTTLQDAIAAVKNSAETKSQAIAVSEIKE